MQKNPIQLDKILIDIAKEKVLHPFNTEAAKKDVEDAWARVGKNNNLSVHESRSIFKVLQKKYDQEKLKSNSSWKLFAIMDQIHKKEEPKDESSDEQNGVSMEDEEEEYEMLDVQEEEKGDHGNSASEDEESTKSMHSPSPKSEKQRTPQHKQNSGSKTNNNNNNNNNSSNEEKKLLNSLVGTQKVSSLSISIPQTTAAALQKKGITMKKTSSLQNSSGTASISSPSSSPAAANQRTFNTQKTPVNGRNTNVTIIENPKAIQLNESTKRKLNEELQTSVSSTSVQPFKKINLGKNHQQIKKERDEENEGKKNDTSSSLSTTSPAGINIITIPANPRIELTNGLVEAASSSTCTSAISSNNQNGYISNTNDLNLKSEIIFEDGSAKDVTNMTLNSSNTETLTNGITKISSKPGDIIDFGNFDNSLPPTFFKNLCNSSRHEALGLYVSNVMNRLTSKSAAKLELKILKALIDVQTEEADI